MATFQPSGGGAAAVAAGTASQSAVAASAAGPSEAGPLGGYSMASASGLRMDPFGDVGIFAEDLGLGNMIDLEAFGGSMVQPAVAAAPPAGAPLPQQAGGSTATAAIVTHELWPTLVELNVAIAELSAPAAGEMGQHNALRHALNNVSARHGSVMRRIGVDPELDAYMGGLVQIVRTYKQNVEGFYLDQEARLANFQASLDQLAAIDRAHAAAAAATSASGGAGAAAAGAAAGGVGDLKAAASAVPTATPDLAALKDSTPFREDLKRRYKTELMAWKVKFSRKQRKGKLPDAASAVLMAYWKAHQEHPYPSDDEKAALCTKASLSKSQVDNWLINMRKRHWNKGVTKGAVGGVKKK